MSQSLIQQFAASSQLSGSNAGFIESLYETWLRDASAVAPEWRAYFDTFKGRQAGDVPHSDAIARIEAAQQRNGHAVAFAAAAPTSDAHAQKQAAVLKLVTAYRSRGHLAANLDPLGMAHRVRLHVLVNTLQVRSAAGRESE
ncbi:MAG: 2-oxoglutarate dehydrogenase E1 subunit family protein, partial [Deltaproteobacteria bacterium]